MPGETSSAISRLTKITKLIVNKNIKLISLVARDIYTERRFINSNLNLYVSVWEIHQNITIDAAILRKVEV